jgi:hypothetical protein
MARIQQEIDQVVQQVTNGDSPRVLAGLAKRIAEAIKGTPRSWDQALWEIVTTRCEEE